MRGGQDLLAERKPAGLQLLQSALIRFGGAATLVAIALSSTTGCTSGPRDRGPAAGATAHASGAVAQSGDASGGYAAIDSARAVDAGPPARTQIDDDGDDDPEDPGTGKAPEPGTARFEKVGVAPMALTRICDLTPLAGSLYAAHANQPLGTDGATITRYTPSDTQKPFKVAFDWNRPGEPTKGGGAGQGFLRVHAVKKRLFVADADPPYGGLGQVDWGTEGYVFVSDKNGAFAPPRAPHFRPPQLPDLAAWDDGKAGAGVLPRAYHVIDVVRFRGAMFASTGSVPPKERAWNGPSPGALHRANADGTKWSYEVDYPFPYQNGVWRLTFMVRFKDRLYAGIQDYDGRDPNDFLVFKPSDPEAKELKREDIDPVRITPSGAAGTLRWWVDRAASPPRLYWIAWARDGVNLRFTTNGDDWTVVPMPAGAGRPTDITRFRDKVVVMTERGLYRMAGDAIDPNALATAPLSTKEKKPSGPFDVTDFFCVAPLAVLDNVLYVGGQKYPATLFKIVDTAP